MRRLLAAVFTFAALSVLAKPVLEQVGEYPIPEANQGVGVDDKHFYAVDNQTIGSTTSAAGSW
jgi:hypothetical protein